MAQYHVRIASLESFPANPARLVTLPLLCNSDVHHIQCRSLSRHTNAPPFFITIFAKTNSLSLAHLLTSSFAIRIDTHTHTHCELAATGVFDKIVPCTRGKGTTTKRMEESAQQNYNYNKTESLSDEPDPSYIGPDSSFETGSKTEQWDVCGKSG